MTQKYNVFVFYERKLSQVRWCSEAKYTRPSKKYCVKSQQGDVTSVTHQLSKRRELLIGEYHQRTPSVSKYMMRVKRSETSSDQYMMLRCLC